MISFPPAKINLGLNILAKRADGYHSIVTCLYPISWTDILEIIVSETFSFSQSGNIVSGKPEDNLCVKAYHLIKNDFAIPPVQIHLHKIIPMGAGLGGGSSNAAWTLRLLQQIFELPLSGDQLKNYASQLGSDCAFFIQDKPALGTGRGEVLTDISIHSLKGKFIVVIKPDAHIATAEAYADVRPQIPHVHLKQILEKSPVDQWKDFLKNDFEESVFKKYPLIGDIKTSLYKEGAVYASMSGSGSSVYGIFLNEVDLKQKFKGMVYWEGRF